MLDGEIVCLDRRGKSQFRQLTRPLSAEGLNHRAVLFLIAVVRLLTRGSGRKSYAKDGAFAFTATYLDTSIVLANKFL